MAQTPGFLFAGGATLVQYNGVDMGATTGGVTIGKQTEWLDFEIDQRKAKVRKEAIMTSMTVKTTLAENKLYNMLTAWSMATSSLNNSGSSSSLRLTESLGTQEGALLIEGPTHTVTTPYTSVAYTKRSYNFFRAVALANTETSLNRGTPTNISCEWECLFDTTQGNPRWGDIWDQ